MYLSQSLHDSEVFFFWPLLQQQQQQKKNSKNKQSSGNLNILQWVLKEKNKLQLKSF